jgi:hypothetical protein
MDILNDLIYQGEPFVVSGCMYVTNCILCNEEVSVSLHDRSVQVCERCKNAWIKMRDIIENSEQKTTDDREKRIKEVLEKLEQTPEGRLIAKGYKDYLDKEVSQ